MWESEGEEERGCGKWVSVGNRGECENEGKMGMGIIN